MSALCAKNQTAVHRSTILVVAVVYHAFLIAAIVHFANGSGGIEWCDGLGLVIICTGLGYLGIGYSYFVRNTLRNSKAFLLLVSKLASCVQNKAVQILIYIMVILSVVIFLVLDTYNDRRRLISASGVIVLVLICTVASKHPKKINWRQVDFFYKV